MTDGERLERRLATILAADVCGYTKLVEADEEGALRALAALRARWSEIVPQFDGRIFHRAGDGMLAEFASPIEALRAALKLQEPSATGLTLRIGVHLGDVVAEGDDLLGHGVNLAARIEAAAAPGEILISHPVLEHVRGRVAAEFHELGKERLKHVEEPVSVYRASAPGAKPPALWERVKRGARRNGVLIAAVFAALAIGGLIAFNVLTRPAQEAEAPAAITLAVLPFANMSGDDTQAYFADGLTDELITALSRISALQVASRASAFRYRDAVDPRQIGRELNVRYMLEGGVQRAGERVRINVQLIDTETGAQVWAENYDRVAADLFDVQDDIVTSVVMEVRPQLYSAAIRVLAERPTRSASAWELYLQSTWTPGALTNSLAFEKQRVAMAERAVAIDPDFGQAHAVLADKIGFLTWVDPPSDTPELRALAGEHARRALETAPEDADVVFNVASYYWHIGDDDAYRRALRRTVELEPTHSLARIVLLAPRHVCARQSTQVMDELRAYDATLSPDSPLRYLIQDILASMHMARGEMNEAEAAGRRARQLFQTIHSSLVLAAVLVQQGKVEEARQIIAAEKVNWPNLDLWHYANTVLPRQCGAGPELNYYRDIFRDLAYAIDPR